MSHRLQTRGFQVVTATVMLICLLALLIPHAGTCGNLLIGVLFLPVFLFGLLDLQQLLRNLVCADEEFLPQAPITRAMFQRPPPSFR